MVNTKKTMISILTIAYLFFSIVVFSFANNAEKSSIAKKELYLQEGHANLHQGRIDKAITLYQKSLSIDSDFTPAKLSLNNAIQKKEIQRFTETVPVNCQTKKSGYNSIYYCAMSYFSIYGQPINPGIIKEFMTGLSDTGNIITAINLPDAQDSNRFSTCYEKIVIKHIGKFYSFGAETKDGWFSYTVYGVTQNGIFVLGTDDYAGGTLDSGGILFLRIEKTKGLTNNGVMTHQVSLVKVGEVSGSPHDVSIDGNVACWKTLYRDQTAKLHRVTF